MGRWDDYEDEWNYYRPAQPIKVQGGLKTKSERGAIGSTWWSRRWIGVLESFSMGTRLTRGRSYARQGQVISIDIEPGLVKAKVQGSQPKPYNVKIQLKPLAERDWEHVIEAMAAQAIFAAKLLASEMPSNIEEAFESVNLSLFPTAVKDLTTNCSCPDWANPCKHIAAVYYLLAERFDEDPFLIFKLRGRTREAIISSLREQRTAATDDLISNASAEAPEAVALLEEDLSTFWQAGEGLEDFAVHPTATRIDKAILKRLGDAPFTLNGQNVTALLARAYDVIDAAITDLEQV
ncbi:MAG: SWIM zinc finger family protein [Ktedonobacteraceae bacterium]